MDTIRPETPEVSLPIETGIVMGDDFQGRPVDSSVTVSPARLVSVRRDGVWDPGTLEAWRRDDDRWRGPFRRIADMF